MRTVSAILVSLRPDRVPAVIQSFREHNQGIGVEIVLCAEANAPGVDVFVPDKRDGPFPAWARSIEHVTGDYFAWLTDDALATPNCLITGADFLDQKPPPFIMEFDVSPTCLANGLQFARWGMMTRRTYELIGFFDPAFGAYFGDVDLGLRCHAAGGGVATCPGAPIRMANNVDDHLNKANVERFHARDEALYRSRWGHA